MKSGETAESLVGRTSHDAWGVYAWLVPQLGEPVRIYAMPDPRGPRKRTKLDVAVWAPMGPGSSSLMCTVGGCDRVMPDGKYAELFLLVRPLPGERALRALAGFLRNVVRSASGPLTTFTPGLLLPLDGAPAPLRHFSSLLVSEPTTFRDGFGVVPFKGGKKVRLLWLVPLLAHEAELHRQQGQAALMADLARRQVDVAQLDRDS